MYQIRLLDEHGVVLTYVFNLTRREAVALYWESVAARVQFMAGRRVICERS